RQAAVAALGAAHPDVDEVALGEVPAVAAQVGFDVQLGRAQERLEALDPLGRQARLALLGHHDFLALGDLPERARHRTAVAARSDTRGRLEGPAIGLDTHAVGQLGDSGDPDTPAHIRAGRRRALQQVVIELAADDAVAGGPSPARLVARTRH